MEDKEKTTTFSSLPLEVKTSILLRLALEDLYRCRCVSKLWRDFISSSDFNRSYLQQLRNKNHANSIIICGNNHSVFDLYSLDFNDPHNMKKATRYFSGNLGSVLVKNLAGSCNGLLCFYHRDLCGDFWVYNPTIHDFKHIFHSLSNTRSKVGFGYDYMNNDYKIVTTHHDRITKSIEFCVYSLKTNSWKLVKSFPQIYRVASPGRGMVYSNNALHWKTSASSELSVAEISKSIISCFDLEKEEYYEIPLPVDHESYKSWDLTNLREYLHLVTYKYNIDSSMEIWIMKEYRLQQSWTKLICFPLHHLLYWPDLRLHALFPYAYSEDQREILLSFGKSIKGFVGLSLHEQDLLELEICGLPYNIYGGRFLALPWVPSFISPTNFCNGRLAEEFHI